MSRFESFPHGLRVGALVSLTLLGCLPPSGVAGPTHPRKSLTEISRAEIEAESSRLVTAYDIIYALRPSMLVSRDLAQPTRSSAVVPQARRGIAVYVDGLLFGGVESLTTIAAGAVRDVRWLSAADATTRYGTGNASGAIVVTTWSGRR
jgi:hypothetical protein